MRGLFLAKIAHPTVRTWAVPVLLLAVMALAACQSEATIPTISATEAALPNTGPTSLPTAVPTNVPTEAPVVMEPNISVVNDPTLGPILVGDNGMTLYMFTKDDPNKSNCDADCLEKWPPLLTQGNPTLGEGVDPELVGSADLTDGSKIVTYNGMPLYYWYRDKKAGDTTGQDVGQVWYVVSPQGEVIKGEAAAATEAPVEATPTTASPSSADASSFQEPTIGVVDDPILGPILVGDNGMTLYMFEKDEPNKSNCTGDCLEKWPPLLTQGQPTLGEGVDASLIGTATLADGSMIVTYNAMPLYYWYKDAQPGDTTGQGVGEVWFVVSPAGAVITAPNAADSASPAENTNSAANTNSNKENKDSDY